MASTPGVQRRLADAPSPFAGVSVAVVPAGDAAARERVAFVGVPVAEARAAGGEAPVSRQAAVTLAGVRPRSAGALTRQLLAEGMQRTLRVAGASCR